MNLNLNGLFKVKWMSVANDCFPILMSDGVEVIEIWWWKDKRHWTDDDVVDGLRGGWGGGRWNVGRKVSKHATWRGNGVVWMDNRRRHLLLNWSIEFPPKRNVWRISTFDIATRCDCSVLKSGYEPQRVPWSWRAAFLDRRSINLHTWLIGCFRVLVFVFIIKLPFIDIRQFGRESSQSLRNFDSFLVNSLTAN